jgi:flagellar protein FlaG
MASVSVSHLVLFIASMIVASAVGVTFIGQADNLATALGAKGDDVSGEIRTDVEVISDPSSPVYNTSGNENVTLLVKNTGSKDLPASGGFVDVIVDGEFASEVAVTVVDGPEWEETNVARLEVSAPNLPAGDHRVKIVVGSDEEVFEFRT